MIRPRGPLTRERLSIPETEAEARRNAIQIPVTPAWKRWLAENSNSIPSLRGTEVDTREAVLTLGVETLLGLGSSGGSDVSIVSPLDSDGNVRVAVSGIPTLGIPVRIESASGAVPVDVQDGIRDPLPVQIEGTPNVRAAISGTPDVAISGTPNVAISGRGTSADNPLFVSGGSGGGGLVPGPIIGASMPIPSGGAAFVWSGASWPVRTQVTGDVSPWKITTMLPTGTSFFRVRWSELIVEPLTQNWFKRVYKDTGYQDAYAIGQLRCSGTGITGTAVATTRIDPPMSGSGRGSSTPQSIDCGELVTPWIASPSNRNIGAIVQPQFWFWDIAQAIPPDPGGISSASFFVETLVAPTTRPGRHRDSRGRFVKAPEAE